MSPYLFTLILGAVGLVVMAATGVARLGHSSHQGHASGHGGHGAHHGAGHGVAHAGARAAGGRGTAGGGRSVAASFWSLTSPRTLFSLCVGFGAVGTVLQPLVPSPIVLGAAVAGAAVFEWVILRPLWNWLLKFESRPALTLESAVFDEARAISGFDANGQGMIAVELDGQMVQLLATLVPEDQKKHATVHSGDVVRIEEVDSKRNRCVVSYVGKS